MRTTLLLSILISVAAHAQSCRWGLGPDYGAAGVPANGDSSNREAACKVAEKIAASRFLRAKKICYSSDSMVHWNKELKDGAKTARTYFPLMQAAMSVTAQGYTRVNACERSDLVAKFDVTMGDSCSLEITDADSGDTVFQETRSIHDGANDLYRLARHFQQARTTAQKEKLAAEWAKQAAEEERTKYDEISHPTLGVLRFPKEMSQVERRAAIAKLELDAYEKQLDMKGSELDSRAQAVAKKKEDWERRVSALDVRGKVYTTKVNNYNERCAKGGYLCESDAYELNRERDSLQAAGVVLADEGEKLEREEKDISKQKDDLQNARRELQSKGANLESTSEKK